MIDFVEFVVSQLKQKALSKDDAIRILRQFSQRSENFAVLHPLLQFNTSDFERQSYSSVFTGEEFFLRDHRVTITKNSTHKILPAVAYLEMARKAVALAHGLEDNEQEVVELLDVVWVRPLLVDDKKKFILNSILLMIQKLNLKYTRCKTISFLYIVRVVVLFGRRKSKQN